MFMVMSHKRLWPNRYIIIPNKVKLQAVCGYNKRKTKTHTNSKICEGKSILLATHTVPVYYYYFLKCFTAHIMHEVHDLINVNVGIYIAILTADFETIGNSCFNNCYKR